jgi:GntR family transcriptional regulator, transcriptional repressor for pyruvate dehydrogenase complex
VEVVTMTGGPDGERLATAEVRVPKAAELVAARIRRQSVDGDLPAGTGLPPEAELVARYGVSRPTLREAFRILESERLVTVRRGVKGGALVQSPSLDVATRSAQALLQYRSATLADVHEARILVEPPAAALLAERRDPAALAALEAAHQRETSAKSSDDLRELGGAFHRTVVEQAGNRTILLFSTMVQQIIDVHTARLQAMQASGRVRRRHRQEGLDDHARLVELVRAGASTEAERFWRQHLQNVSRWLLEEVDAETVLELVE